MTHFSENLIKVNWRFFKYLQLKNINLNEMHLITSMKTNKWFGKRTMYEDRHI
jgi:hypothetical protein